MICDGLFYYSFENEYTELAESNDGHDQCHDAPTTCRDQEGQGRICKSKLPNTLEIILDYWDMSEDSIDIDRLPLIEKAKSTFTDIQCFMDQKVR